MSERPWIEDGLDDAFTKELLASATVDVPDAAKKAAFLEKIGSGGTGGGGSAGATSATAIAGAAAGASAIGTKTLGLGTYKWLIVIGMVSSVIAFAVLKGPSATDTPAHEANATSSASASTAPVASTAPIPSASTIASASTSATPSAIASTSASAPAASTSAPSAASASIPAPAPLGLAEETALLDQARSALASGNPRGALATLDRYDRLATQRILGQEATMVRIQALKSKGDDAGARALARRFLAANPGSTYEERIHKLLGEQAP